MLVGFKLIKKVFGIWVVLTILLGLLIWAELGIRIVRPLYFKYLKKDPLAYYELPGTFDLEQHFELPWTLRPKYRFYGRQYTRHAPSGVFRALVFGGSTGYGYKVGLDTFPNFLETAIIKQGRDAQVINFSVVGYSIRHSLYQLINSGIDLEPEVAILYQGPNEIPLVVNKIPNYPDNPSDDVRTGAHWSHHFYLTTFLRRADLWDRFVEMMPSFDPIKEAWPSNFVVSDPGPLEPIAATHAAKVYKRNVEQFILIARQAGILPVLAKTACLCIDPEAGHKLTPYEQRFGAELAAYNVILDDLGAKYQIPVANTDLINGRGKFFIDNTHQNSEGHRQQAAALLAAFKKFPYLAAELENRSGEIPNSKAF